MTANPLKANFAIQHKYEAFYTGGKVQLSKEGDFLLSQCGTKVQVLQVTTGQVLHAIGQDDDGEVTCFVLSPDDQVLVVANRNLVLRQWRWKDNVVERTWKAIHTGPVSCMSFDCTSTLLATGGSDSTIKVWDVIKQYCTHNLRGHTGVVSVAAFHPDIDRLQLFSAAGDYKIRIWDLRLSTCIATLESHYSVVTSIQFSLDGNILYSGGLDNVVTVWDIETFQKKKTIPVYESVEALVLLPPERKLPALNVTRGDPFFLTGGSKGMLRVWNARTAQCVFEQPVHEDKMKSVSESESKEGDEEGKLKIVDAFLCLQEDTITTITNDHNIMMYKLEDLGLHKQFVGYNDEILDIKFMGEKDSHIAVATNSELIKVFEVGTWACQVLAGHSDIVLALDVFHDGTLLASSSKDKSVRLWHLDMDSHRLECVAVGYGHTHAVPAVSFSRLSRAFVVTASQDCTLKVWPINKDVKPGQVSRLHTKVTEKAHDMDINCVSVAPNDKLIVTGSLDKTAKLWSSSDLSLLGVFRGHKRGIWCVQFSPVDQCLASTSVDGTIKIWALSDFSCVKTFEGHESSVLKGHFLTRGMQFLSSGSDGLLKLWTISSSECVKTFDEHEEKIWALAVNQTEDLVVTGAGDSTIILWKDVTEEEVNEARLKEEDMIIKQQKLSNLVQAKKYVKAIGLAITLEQPFRVLSIMKEVLNESNGKEELEAAISKLRMDQLDAVLRYAVQWNTNSKHCHVAQFVLTNVLKTHHPDDLFEFPNFKSSLEGLLPYTERHLARMDRLLQQSVFVDYTWQCMRRVGTSVSTEEMDVETTGSSNFLQIQDSPMSAPIRHDEALGSIKPDTQSMEVSSGSESESSSENDSVENSIRENKKKKNSSVITTVPRVGSTPQSSGDSSENDSESSGDVEQAALTHSKKRDQTSRKSPATTKSIPSSNKVSENVIHKSQRIEGSSESDSESVSDIDQTSGKQTAVTNKKKTSLNRKSPKLMHKSQRTNSSSESDSESDSDNEKTAVQSSALTIKSKTSVNKSWIIDKSKAYGMNDSSESDSESNSDNSQLDVKRSTQKNKNKVTSASKGSADIVSDHSSESESDADPGELKPHNLNKELETSSDGSDINGNKDRHLMVKRPTASVTDTVNTVSEISKDSDSSGSDSESVSDLDQVANRDINLTTKIRLSSVSEQNSDTTETDGESEGIISPRRTPKKANILEGMSDTSFKNRTPKPSNSVSKKKGQIREKENRIQSPHQHGYAKTIIASGPEERVTPQKWKTPSPKVARKMKSPATEPVKRKFLRDTPKTMSAKSKRRKSSSK